ncbi:unnamed protein product [Urochloa humidicola]
MASVRRAALLLLPLVLVVAVRWLCRRRRSLLLARAHHQYCLPSAVVEKAGGELLPPVALYMRPREEEQCSVVCVFCLSAIEEGSEVRELSCRHLFHRSCLDRWLLLARPLATCPLCRRRLLLSAPAAATRTRTWTLMT